MARLLRLAALALLAARAPAARVGPELPRGPAELPPELVERALALVPPRVAYCLGENEVTLLQGHAKRHLQHFWPVAHLQFSASGHRLLAAGLGGAVVWDLSSRLPPRELRPGSPAELRSVAIFPDGARVVALDSLWNATIWFASSGQVQRSWQLREAHRSVVVLHGGERVLTGVGGEHITTWSAAGGGLLQHLWHPGEHVGALVLSTCGRKIGTAGARKVAIWSAVSGRLERVLSRTQEAMRGPLRLSISSGAAWVICSVANSILVWDGHTGELLRRIAVGEHMSNLAMLPGARAIGVTPAEVPVWDLATGALLYDLAPTPGGFAARLAIGAGGDVVAVCGDAWDGEDWRSVRVRVWDGRERRLLHTVISPYAGQPCSVAVGPSFFELPMGV